MKKRVEIFVSSNGRFEYILVLAVTRAKMLALFERLADNPPVSFPTVLYNATFFYAFGVLKVPV